MPEAWVVNASPIILYARIGRLDLIEALAPRVIIPQKVIEEIQHGASKDDTANDAVSWAMRYSHRNLSIPASVERWDLGPGESQVISVCMATLTPRENQTADASQPTSPHSEFRWAVLDDKMARRCVSAHELEMIGSLGIILRAKVKGLINSARPWGASIEGCGFIYQFRPD